MSTKPALEAAPPLNIPAVDRYLLMSLYLLVITGFGTLAATGQLDGPSVLFVTAALLWRGYLLLIRRRLVIPESWSTGLAVAFVVFYALDMSLISRSFLAATVHLVMAGLVVKMFSPLRDRDYVLLSALSFAMVLAASVLTVDSAFFIAFCVFLLTAVATFILLQMHRAVKQATAHAAGRESPDFEHRLGASLGIGAPSILAAILALAGGIFFVLPRVSAGYAGAFGSGNDLSTGFSDEVRLGSIGEIQQSPAIVMHVKIKGGTTPTEIKWRGVTLSAFDGFTWSNPHQTVVARHLEDGRFLLPQNIATNGAGLLRYRVMVEPMGSNVFFLAEQPITLSGNYSLVSVDASAAAFDLDHDHPVAAYEGESNPVRPGVAQLRASDRNYPFELAQAYLQLPAVDPRIIALAQEVTGGADSNYDKAAALENYLSTHFGYTLQLPPKTPEDPLADFLFKRKRGHCEYFASAMAVMLRTLGIPSRIVNGFRGGEYNDLSGQFVVRARDAHSWVEAYFPGQGWVSFDPTPPASLSTNSGGSGRFALYLDAMTSFWREWVVNYDFGHQKSLGEEAARRGRTFFEGLRGKLKESYGKLLQSARTAKKHTGGFPTQWTGWAAALLGLGLLLSNSARLGRLTRHLRLQYGKKQPAPQMAAFWYQRMTKTLSRRGWEKAPGQTASEFVGAIPDVRLKESVARFTRHYERARFADSKQDAERLREIYEEVVSASR